jgi:hypothetical protein
MSKIEVIRGDDITINATFKDDNGDAINITGYTVFFTVKDNYTSTTDSAALISKTVTTHSSPTTGATTFDLSNTDTNLSEGDYYYDFQLKDTTNKISSTQRGIFSVSLDVTRRTS